MKAVRGRAGSAKAPSDKRRRSRHVSAGSYVFAEDVYSLILLAEAPELRTNISVDTSPECLSSPGFELPWLHPGLGLGLEHRLSLRNERPDIFAWRRSPGTRCTCQNVRILSHHKIRCGSTAVPAFTMPRETNTRSSRMYEIHQIEDTPLLTLPRENTRCDLGITVFLHSWNQRFRPENFLIALVLQLTTGLSRGCNMVFAPRCERVGACDTRPQTIIWMSESARSV